MEGEPNAQIFDQPIVSDRDEEEKIAGVSEWYELQKKCSVIIWKNHGLEELEGWRQEHSLGTLTCGVLKNDQVECERAAGDMKSMRESQD
jgi:hypothetical protein